MKKLKQINSKVRFKNPWWEYKLDKYELPNGKVGEYHYVHTAGSTFIIPVLKNGDIIMVKQFRYLNGKESIEFPGGGLPEGIKPEENAIKELKEETGYKCNNIEKQGVFNPYNGVTNEICHVFVASELQDGIQELEESEEVVVLRLSIDELEEKIATNEIWDGMTLAAWSLYKYQNKGK